MISKCSFCHGSDIETIYQGGKQPVFQNVAYPDPDSARRAPVGDMVLGRCACCGFVFNTAFDPSLIKYDRNYQNEQANSPLFADYLAGVARGIAESVSPGARIVEIGCGKGTFLGLLLDLGLDAYGVDPTYEGDNPRVVKAEFNEESASMEADLVILRHVLEHIPDPAGMLKTIARLNRRQGQIYIEIPSLDWILDNGAFWDFSYEHSNYFSEDVLGRIFPGGRVDRIFGGQYLGVFAGLDNGYKLDCLARPAADHGLNQGIEAKLEAAKKTLEDHGPVLVWGAGGKGSTFVNTLDPQRQSVAALVDINPRKQSHFIARSAHPIIPPEDISGTGARTILVMNPNYYSEVAKLVGPEYRLLTL